VLLSGEPESKSRKRNEMKKLFTVILLGCALLQARTASAISGTSALTSSFTPGSFVWVDWDVTSLGGGFYQYLYQVENPGNVSGPETFTLTFDTSLLAAAPFFLGGNILAGPELPFGPSVPLPGTSVTPTDVTWNFTAVTLGTQQAYVMGFVATGFPHLGNGLTADSIPPSPWTTLGPDADKLPIPGVPDGGLTLALLGFALVGVEGLRRKLTA
jgi:hypothetical protein